MKELYLITGATGHLGSALVHALYNMNKRIRILALPHETDVPDYVEVVRGNVLDRISLEAFFKHEKNESLIVIHCAGIVSIMEDQIPLMQRVNVHGTQYMLEMSLRHQVKQFIYVSSVHAIEEKPKGELIKEVTHFNPDKVVGAYAKTKAQATNLALEKVKEGLDVRVVHPSGIVGPYDKGNGHLTQFILTYMKGKLPFAIEGGYDFVDVRDVAKGIIQVIEKGEKGACYILSNRYYTIKELYQMLQEITHKKEVKHCIPIKFVKQIAPLFETYYKLSKQKPLFTSYSLYTLSSNGYFSHEKATQQLNYQTRSMKETLQDTLWWLEENDMIKG